ncbi:MAG: 30S ribosomal protein S9 [Candidatus Taylorbacteria bacterium CG10_big_fil_rev_8_21_14_0_10_41_48]|uniref:30S ribosomal protein S9 n=1 Tax=Candidatus Taylorbacteria bacterium CG10_big_fil_rev_8_21_14_0_10_41_48 TaxID=1975024 RepID=A0A2M8LCF6_9BACT|nr:MAG: 30S ribosomal protein S9 [Candidatus Taylorbacteria bacterium CG10_big_fil_rev_8_21_14_0_10_41_48]
MTTTNSTKEKYFEAVGRRKTAIARARITPGSKQVFSINDKDLATYFATLELQAIAAAAFVGAKIEQKFHVSAKIEGGGIHSQAEALRHAIARALLDYDIELRKKLKKEGYLKRDPRAKERRKFGLKKARKSPQWSKR